MAMLTVRNLNPRVHQRLREQAARRGRSMEAEARAILEAGLGSNTTDLVTQLRDFAEQVRPTRAELDVVSPGRRQELARPVGLGGEA